MKNFYYLIILALLWAGCKKDDEEECCDPTNPLCANYDPCFGIDPTAEFRMRGTLPSFVVPENFQAEWCDTIFREGVEFMANMENADSYEWYIGTETEPRFGRSLKINFSNYYEDTLQNLNPDNPDYYLPLDITLIVRNEEGPCVNESDTLLTATSQLVLTRKTLTHGTFVGRIVGENFDREVTLWLDSTDLSAPSIPEQYYSQIIGLSDDTLRYYGPMASSIANLLVSYKRRKWDENLSEWWLATDGIQVWDQEIITSSTQPDRIELYFERYPEGSTTLESKRFSGTRVD